MNTPKCFLRLPAVIEHVGKSRSAIYRDIQAGTFPAPIRIGAQSVAWDESAIVAWQARQGESLGMENAVANVPDGLETAYFEDPISIIQELAGLKIAITKLTTEVGELRQQIATLSRGKE
jgi:prophage regulatory protein